MDRLIPSQRAREAAAALSAAWEGRDPQGPTLKAMRCGDLDRHDFAQAFARFEQETEQRVRAEIVEKVEGLKREGESITTAYHNAAIDQTLTLIKEPGK